MNSTKVSFFLSLAAALFVAGCSDSAERQDSSIAPGAGAASSSGDAATGKTVVTFWHAISGPHETVVGAMADEFEALHPDIDIQPLNQGQYAQLKLKLNNALATDSPPTIAMAYEGWATEFYENEYLTVLQDFVDTDDTDFHATLDDFFPAFLEANRRDDKLISVPFNKSTYIVFYNKALFGAAGLEEFPSSLEAMWEAARNLTQRDEAGDPSVFGMGIRATLEPFTCLFMAEGGSFLSGEGDALRVVDTPEAEHALKTIRTLINDEKVAYVDGNYMSDPFGNQRIAFYWGSSAGIPFVQRTVGDKFEIGTASLPLAESENAGYLSQGTNLVMFDAATDKEKQAGWEFLKFLMQANNNARFAADTGYLPVRRAALEEKILADYVEANPPYRTCIEQMERLRFEPVAGYWEQIRNDTIQEFDSAYRGRKTVREALDKAEDAAHKTIRRAADD